MVMIMGQGCGGSLQFLLVFIPNNVSELAIVTCEANYALSELRDHLINLSKNRDAHLIERK